ncbi:Queuosine biosynthesis protein QueC [Granulibacter bethesdensis CGDNIH1]|nr:Queuosine biosynthesis protein QueC [Granulibacter bethesdensis CGDNIH1]APH52887.1 Queuosine biosynthesis protein QueC [Granulibacter bethesdensis]APH65575.1 Queuosine biosynthesis protein QueC [Granulibacter bethesdensis]
MLIIGTAIGQRESMIETKPIPGLALPRHDHALVLFSGGQDSTTCLAWALERFAHVETIGFTYGQRHSVEMECRGRVRQVLAHMSGRSGADWGSRLGDDHVLDLGNALHHVGQSALTGRSPIEIGQGGLPTSFVPGRNLIFLTYAAALGWRRGLRRMVGGMCETDYSGYPDCRDDTIKAMQLALNTGMEAHFVLETPLMWLTKAETWALADSLGGPALVALIEEETHTCYLGDRSQRHPWGYGCGECPACSLRAEGWREWQTASSA